MEVLYINAWRQKGLISNQAVAYLFERIIEQIPDYFDQIENLQTVLTDNVCPEVLCMVIHKISDDVFTKEKDAINTVYMYNGRTKEERETFIRIIFGRMHRKKIQ